MNDRLAAGVARLKTGEAIRRTKNTYAWDGGNQAVAKGTVDTLLSCGYLKADAGTALFDDGIAKPQLYVWSGKELVK